MKNILIICGSFPPQSLVGGLRPAMFAKYLRNYGWNPHILTRDFTPDDPRYDDKMPVELPGEVIKHIYKVKYSLRDEQKYLKSRTIFLKIRDFFYPEYSSPPGIYFAVRRAAEDIIKNTAFDLLFATVPDQWELSLGSYLTKKYGIPLIADFRDIKEQENGLKRSFRGALQSIRFSIRRYLTTRNVIHITTVSEFHKQILERKLRKACSVVYNGFESSMFRPMNVELTKGAPFRIIYMGRILNTWYQNPYILFRAIDELIDELKINIADITIEFYGTDEEKLATIIADLKNPGFIKFFERVSYNEVAAKLNEAQMLLLLTNSGRKGILTTKFFEYAGIKKPILCIPGDKNELDSIIYKYNLGYSISDKAELKDKLICWISDFNAGKFPIHISSDVDFFSRENQSGILSEVFNKSIGIV